MQKKKAKSFMLFFDKLRGLKIKKPNKQFLVFLLFVFVSASFWFMQVCQERDKFDVTIPFKVVNIPDRVVVTSDVPDTIVVSVIDYGFEYFKYSFFNDFLFDEVKRKKKVITVDFSTMVDTTSIRFAGGDFSIDNNKLRRMVTRYVSSTSRISNISPANIIVSYCPSISKKVPVVLTAKVKKNDSYFVVEKKLNPDSVKVYAPSYILDTITAAFTEPKEYTNLSDTIKDLFKLQRIQGAKFEPDVVNVSLNSDVLIRKRLQVKVYSENIPQNKILRTFPPRVFVSYSAVSGIVDNVVEDDFFVVVDYSEIRPSDRTCRIKVRSYPSGLRDVRVSPEYVDFVIENND